MKHKQKQEALARMKMLKLNWSVVKEFREEGKLNKSEFGGILYLLTDAEKEMVKTFEEQHNSLVYHVIHNFTEFGELYSLLYVSQDEEEREDDRNDITQGYALVYVKNKTNEVFSEFGSIGIKPQYGGLVRTA